ncbi:MAG: group 1 glycosyl transferase [Candidatus Peregrinibacteria bacterium Greene0416_19]|nr:MAG: group 1 glycosyl transferase [Candidatus Peregrinibacteria bacterium Greene0416_19]
MQAILLISPYFREEHRWMVSTVKLAELWQRLGYRVIVACMGAKTGREAVSDTLTIYRKKDFFIPDPWNTGIAFGFTGMARRIIREERPDIIIVNKVLFWTSLTLIALRARGIHALLLTDALVGITWMPRGRLPRIVARIAAWTVGWIILRCAARIVTFHPQPGKVLKRLGVAGKTQVVPTGIDLGPFRDSERETRDSGSRVTVTYLGRLESVKGVDDYLAAAVELKKEHPGAKFQVVGWYKEGHPLVAQYEREVLFTGLRHDIAAILASTDIFVLPSYSEGLSNSLMEAMASGCACVASDVGGNAYLIQNGVSGFLFPAGDRQSLAAHIRRLIEDPHKRKAMGEAAQRRIAQSFAWEIVGSLYDRLFAEMTPSSPAAPDRYC